MKRAAISFVLALCACNPYADECFLPTSVSLPPVLDYEADGGVWEPEEPQRIQTGQPVNITIATEYTNLLTKLNKEREEAETAEAKRALSLAITKVEEAQMWTGKAFSAEMVNGAEIDSNY